MLWMADELRYTLQICSSDSKLFWRLHCFAQGSFGAAIEQWFHSRSLTTLVCTTGCSEFNSGPAWKAITKEFSLHLQQALKPVHMLKQKFPYGLSHAEGGSHFWSPQDLCLVFILSFRCSQNNPGPVITDTAISKIEKIAQHLLACSQKKRGSSSASWSWENIWGKASHCTYTLLLFLLLVTPINRMLTKETQLLSCSHVEFSILSGDI